MPELFIVLFFGSAMLIRYIFRKVEEIKSDNARKLELYTKEKETERWISEVCDEELFEEIEYYVHNFSNKAEVSKIVNEAFKEAGITSLNYNEIDAIRVLLAHKGKLMWEDAMFGISIWYKSEQTVRDKKEAIENRRKFVSWINSKLIEHGINEDMFIKTLSDKYYTFDYDKSIPGRCMWRPSIYPSRLENVNKL